MREIVESVVLDALALANRSRPVDKQLRVAIDAVLFGEGSALDSLGLVAVVIDVEDGLREHGLEVDLASAQALSRQRSPFRTVQALVDYITSKLADEQPS